MLNFFAPINHLGYGVFSYNLIRAYEKFVSGDMALFPSPHAEFMNDDIQRWINNGIRFNRNDPSLMIFQAPWLNRFSGRPMIGMPIFELDITPEYDLNVLKALDVVFQPSEWGKRMLQQQGVESVYVVPGGYDPEIYSSSHTFEQKLERIERQGVSFVHVGKFEVRKSSEEILHCFAHACDGLEQRVNLMFHVYNPFDSQWFEKIKHILTKFGFGNSGSQFVRGNVRITVPTERFASEPKKVYQSGDFGIWASKAEGWNLPLLECIACGIPCITTNNTAQADFIREGIYPKELILKSNQTEPTRIGSGFWKLDAHELTQKIRQIIQEPQKYLKLQEACTKSVQDFTWEKAAKKMATTLQQLV